MKITEATESYLEYLGLKNKSSLTVRNYRSYLSAFCEFAGDREVTAISIDDIDRFHGVLVRKSLSFSTQSYYLITLRSFFRFLRVRKELAVLDPLRIELPKITRPIKDALSDDEIKALTNAAASPSREDSRARAIIELLLSSGIRVQELCNLKITQLDFKEKIFRVYGKGDKERACFMNDETVHYLKRYLATRKNNTAFLFSSTRVHGEQKRTTRSVERTIKEYALRAGIHKQVTPHMLRRTFAVRLLRKNVDLRYIQDFLGHESIQTTTLYTKIERSDLERVYRLANKKATTDVKEKEQVILGKESLAKLSGMIGNTMRKQNEILRKLEGKKEKPLPVRELRKLLN